MNLYAKHSTLLEDEFGAGTHKATTLRHTTPFALSKSSFTLAMNKVLCQFGQYILVGGTAFIVDFTSLYLLTEKLGAYYLVSATLGFLLGLATNYALCIVWVFDVRVLRKNRLQEFTVFGLIGIAGLGFNTLILSFLTEVVKLHYLYSKLAAAALILVFNFSLRRWALFSDKEGNEPSDSSSVHKIHV